MSRSPATGRTTIRIVRRVRVSMTEERWQRFLEMAEILRFSPEKVLRLWIEQKITDTFGGLDK